MLAAARIGRTEGHGTADCGDGFSLSLGCALIGDCTVETELGCSFECAIRFTALVICEMFT